LDWPAVPIKTLQPACAAICLFLAPAGTLGAQFITHLSPAAEQAFERYRAAAEEKMEWKARPADAAKPGDVAIAPFGKEGSFSIEDGLVHDWTAATVVRGATVERALKLLQDYANYQNIYAPDVSQSRLLNREANKYHVALRLAKKGAFPVQFDSESDVEFRALSEGRWAVLSRSTKMAELDGEREFPPGTGKGFLWRLNAYWLIEPRPEGVYLECRSISLSRDIPVGLNWMVKPIVSNLSRDSLRSTMEATVRGLR
jgi:hypothetical protein